MREVVVATPLSVCAPLRPKTSSNEGVGASGTGGGWLGVVWVGASVMAGVDEERSDENALSNENGWDSGTGGRTGRPSTADTGRAELAAFCGGLNVFSNPVSRTGEIDDFTIPLLVGAGGNAEEAEDDTLIAGRDALGSALVKSN